MSAPGLRMLALASLLALAAPASAGAQALGTLGGDGDEPIEISASEGIEWRRDEKLYIARGDARAARGEIEVYADVLAAHYEGDDGGSTITRIDAIGEVRIVSPNGTVYGDTGAYDVERRVFVIRGRNLRLEGNEDHLTARDSLEYWEDERLAVARGDATATRKDRKIVADVLIAHFEPGQTEKLELDRVDAEGNVKISTRQDFVSGERGVYYVKRQIAVLKGDVKITRGNNQLNGETAEVNLATGISKLRAGEGGRVEGLVLPLADQRPRHAGASR